MHTLFSMITNCNLGIWFWPLTKWRSGVQQRWWYSWVRGCWGYAQQVDEIGEELLRGRARRASWSHASLDGAWDFHELWLCSVSYKRWVVKVTVLLNLIHDVIWFRIGLTGLQLHDIIWGGIRRLQEISLQVDCIVCDGGKANRKFFHDHMSAEGTRDGVVYKVCNMYDPTKFVYFMCDVPHLMKTTRNCWASSHSQGSRYPWVSHRVDL